MTNDNGSWAQGFWTGMLWLSYEFTGNKKYSELALKHIGDFSIRIKKRLGVNHHDMGFLYCPSCVTAYRLFGDSKAKEAAILAADNLCSRFNERSKFIQAWGKIGAEDNFRLIIDCMMNLPLLFWAADVTGNENYRRIAKSHLKTSVKYVFRDDGTTYHTYFFDRKTGKPLKGVTAQGYSDNSVWARGQAWGIYGTALGYTHTMDDSLIEKFRLVEDAFEKRLPKDFIPAWDMVFTDTKTTKDTSASAAAICGILLMNRFLKSKSLEKTALLMTEVLQSCHTDEKSNGILAHAVYSMPANLGVDECNIWGDYFYMEALMRIKNPGWKSCWE